MLGRKRIKVKCPLITLYQGYMLSTRLITNDLHLDLNYILFARFLYFKVTSGITAHTIIYSGSKLQSIVLT